MDVDFNRNKIFSLLTEDEKQALLTTCSQEIVLEKGAFIAHEGEAPGYFYFILRGTVQILKKDNTGTDHIIDTLHPGELAGDTALVEDQPRAVSYRAAESVTVLAFNVENIKQNLIVHDKLTVALSKNLAARLRRFKNLTLESMQHRLNEYQKRVALGAFLVGAIYVTDIYVLSLFFINMVKEKFDSITIISVVILVIIVIINIIYIKKFKYPLKMFGITTRNWKKDCKQAILYSLVFIGLFTLVKWLLISTVFKGITLFDVEAVLQAHAAFSWSSYFISLVGYIVFVPFQEFIVRGTLQGTFYRFLAGTEFQRTWTAILVSNLLFAIVHLHGSPFFPFLAFVQGLFWGYLYSKQSSLIGVIISHWLIGIWAIFICGIERLI